jgi:hypothetical protein
LPTHGQVLLISSSTLPHQESTNGPCFVSR